MYGRIFYYLFKAILHSLSSISLTIQWQLVNHSPKSQELPAARKQQKGSSLFHQGESRGEVEKGVYSAVGDCCSLTSTLASEVFTQGL